MGMPQAVKVAPFGPSPTRQKKMPQTIFPSDKGAVLEKVAGGGGPKMIHLTPVVFLDNPAFVNFGQQIFKIKPNI